MVQTLGWLLHCYFATVAIMFCLLATPAASQCSAVAGSPSIGPLATHDGALGLIVVDVGQGRLPAGTVTSWKLYNWGASNDISLQVWRPGGKNEFTLVCETKTTLEAGPKVLTIAASPGCDTEDGDFLGWYQKGSAGKIAAPVGGIAADTMKCDAACVGEGHPGCGKCGDTCTTGYRCGG